MRIVSRFASCVDRFFFGPLTAMEREQALRSAIRRITPDGASPCHHGNYTFYEPYIIVPKTNRGVSREEVVYLRFLEDELEKDPNLAEHLIGKFSIELDSCFRGNDIP